MVSMALSIATSVRKCHRRHAVSYGRARSRGMGGRDTAGRGHRRARLGQRKDHCRNGFDGRAARSAGHRVAPFKVGPDFIDPGYHALATGRPGRNLDPVLVGDALIGPLYRHGSADADIAVVEGVMGLFDGRIEPAPASGPARGSTAHVAALLGAPVVLVVDARGQSHSIAALLHGFSTFDTGDPAGRGDPQPGRVGRATSEVLRQACETGRGAGARGRFPAPTNWRCRRGTSG